MPKANSKTTTPPPQKANFEQDALDVAKQAPEPVRHAGLDSLFVAYDDTEEHLNVLYWGKEGSGKTIDIATATQLGRVLFINAEGGLKKRALQSHGVKTENLIVYPRPGEPITYEGLLEVCFKIKSDLMDDPESWYLVAMDSITEIAQAFTDIASEDRMDKAQRRNAYWNPTIGDRMFTDLSDYGTSTKMVRKLIRMYRDLPVHFAMTALERRDVDEDTSKVAYGPAVGPALQTALLGYVDVVLYCKAADEERPYFRAQSKKVGAARAKDRLGVLPKVLVDPTFPRLVAYNSGTLTEETDPVQAPVREAGSPSDSEGTKATKAPRSGAKARKTPPSAQKTPRKPRGPLGDNEPGGTEQGYNAQAVQEVI